MNRPKGMLIVCNYAPAGNIEGRRPYKSGESCSECPKGKECVCEESKEELATTTKATTTEKPTLSTQMTPKTNPKEIFTTTTTAKKPKSTKTSTTIKPVYDSENESISKSNEKDILVTTTTINPVYDAKKKDFSDKNTVKITTAKEILTTTTTIKPLYEPDGREFPVDKIPKVSETVNVIPKVVHVTKKSTSVPSTTSKTEIFYKPTTTNVPVEKSKKDHKNKKSDKKTEKPNNDKNKNSDELKPKFEFVQLENESTKTALMPEKSDKVEEDFNKTEDVGKNEISVQEKKPYVQKFVRVKMQFNFCGLK